MIPVILGAAAAVTGLNYLWKKGCEADQANYNRDVSVWNGGYCPNCGKKWHWHIFRYRDDYHDLYSAVGLDCRKCNIHYDMYHYDPISRR